MARNRKTFSVIGREAFAEILNAIGVPRKYIGSTALVKALNKKVNSTSNRRKSNNIVKNNSTRINFHSFTDNASGNSTSKSLEESIKKRLVDTRYLRKCLLTMKF